MKMQCDREIDVLRLAEKYGKARLRWLKIYDKVGRNGFDPKSVDQLFRSESAKDLLEEKLLKAAMEYAKGMS
jgi:hypothetical protein